MIYPDLFHKELDVPGEQSGFIPTSDLSAAHPHQICCHSVSSPLLWTQLVTAPWISLPGRQESHVSIICANSTSSPISYFWHCSPIPQSLTYQDNKQNQRNNLFVFLILPFFPEWSPIFSPFSTTTLCSLSSSVANILKPNSTFPLLCLCGHVSTWVTLLMYNVK